MGSGGTDAGGEEQRQPLQLNMVSAISAKGSMRFMVVEGRMNGERSMAFLKRLIHNAGRPISLVVDGHPSHRGKIVTQFVKSTEGRLRLFLLPGYSPELSPDDFLWKYVQHQKVAVSGSVVCPPYRHCSLVDGDYGDPPALLS